MNKEAKEQWEQLWKDLEETQNMPTFQEDQDKRYNTKHIKASEMGMGASMMANYADPVQGLLAEIRGGSGYIEFSPSISQGQGYHTFTKIGEEKRQALREIAKINKVKIGTHAHPNVTGLTGFNERSYSFDEEQRKYGIDEVKKAIDFAKDIGHGGSITFHAGDFNRPLAGQRFDETGHLEFEKSEEEMKNMIIGVIDKENNSLIKESIARLDNEIIAPILDYEGNNKLSLKLGDKTFTFDNVKVDEKGEVEKKSYKNFKHYAADLALNDEHFRKKYLNDVKFDPKKDIKEVGTGKDKHFETTNYKLLEQAVKKKHKDDMVVGIYRNSVQGLNQYERQLKDIREYKHAIQEATEVCKSGKETKMFVQKENRGMGRVHPLTESQKKMFQERFGYDDKDFLEITKNGYDENAEVEPTYYGTVKVKDIANAESQVNILKENQISQLREAANKIEQEQFATVSEMAKEQNRRSFEQLGIELYEKNKAMKKQHHDAEDLYFAIENLWADKYGSTPTELLDVISQAREGMKKGLVNKYNFSEKKAEEIAKNSVRATFDTGHLNMWKKYFKRNQGESDEQFHKRFDAWALNETKKLVDAEVIGNIHLADNFGYDDDHLTLGQGNVPIQEYLKLFDEGKGNKKITGRIAVEGFDDSGERHGVREAWKTSGTQIFKSQQATQRWTDPTFGGSFSSKGTVDYGFGGLNAHTTGYYNKPNFIFGKYVPDREDWAPWSDTGLE